METGDITQLLQAQGVFGAERLMRPNEFAIHRLLQRATIPSQDFGAELQTSICGRAAIQDIADDDASVVQLGKRNAEPAIGLFAEKLADSAQGHTDMSVGNLPEEVAAWQARRRRNLRIFGLGKAGRVGLLQRIPV